MGDTTSVNVKLIAPELAIYIDANTALVTLILGDVADQITSSVYGGKQERAQRYLAAHLLSLAYQSSIGVGGSGPVEIDKVGDVQVKYGSTQNYLIDATRYDETPYGRTYMAIRRGCIGAFRSITP